MKWELAIEFVSVFAAGYFVGQIVLARRITPKLGEIRRMLDHADGQAEHLETKL